MSSAALKKIHIARRDMGLDDDVYRSILARVAGVRSSKELTPHQIGRVLAEFERLGWVAKPAAKRATKRTGRVAPNPSDERQALVGKIEAQLAEAGRPWEYVDSMARRMYKVERVEWCDPTQLRGVVAALTKDAKRKVRAE
ncbi:gp16 family protein [Pseudomonas sp. F(2018)]|uniref:gp16 family protein n=1 Tax=Pseudomonas sp. F(2018) TaxID=2502240 RepID=UPI0010F50EF5|nr:regulatory protein GemA [Pseudomonas sp. F(2018)]